MEESSDNKLSAGEQLSHSDADSAFSRFHSDIASNNSESDEGGQNYSDILVSETSSVSSKSDTADVEIDSQ